MKLTLFGKEINVELPADPVAFVQEWALKILDAMGYSWPMTNTDVSKPGRRGGETYNNGYRAPSDSVAVSKWIRHSELPIRSRDIGR